MTTPDEVRWHPWWQWHSHASGKTEVTNGYFRVFFRDFYAAVGYMDFQNAKGSYRDLNLREE